MTGRDKVCLDCLLPDCLPAHPGCLLRPKKSNKEEEKILPPGPWGIEDTAARLKCSPDWLRKEIRKLKSGHVVNIPRFFMIGNRYRWEEEDVETWIRANKKGGAA